MLAKWYLVNALLNDTQPMRALNHAVELWPTVFHSAAEKRLIGLFCGTKEKKIIQRTSMAKTGYQLYLLTRISLRVFLLITICGIDSFLLVLGGTCRQKTVCKTKRNEIA